MKKNIRISFVIVMLFLVANVNASLMGDSVVVDRQDGPFTYSSQTVAVTTAVELTSFQNWAIDIADYSIAMFSLSNTGYTSGVASFNGFVFSSLDFGLANENISDVFVTGIDQSRVSFTDDTIALDFSWLGFSNTAQINISIETKIASVPESSSIFILVFGCLALFGLARRKK